MKATLNALSHIDLTTNYYQVNSLKPVLSTIYFEVKDSTMNPFQLFLNRYGSIPNHYKEVRVDVEKAYEWFIESYKNTISDYHHVGIRKSANEESSFATIYCLCLTDLLLVFNFLDNTIDFLYRETDFTQIESLINGLHLFAVAKNEDNPTISIMVNGYGGEVSTKELPVVQNNLNLMENYNDDLLPIHETLLNRLTKNNDKGIILLHGKPGTGKTSYLRHLISKMHKNVIYITPAMAPSLLEPYLIEFVINNRNSVFIIEDAETIIKDRDTNNNSPVSALLNLADGLLSDSLNMQIICTFNTDLSHIDPALLRKGRLIGRYEFKELEVAKANALSYKLGIGATYVKPVSLTEIYNHNESNFLLRKPKSTIGFGA